MDKKGAIFMATLYFGLPIFISVYNFSYLKGKAVKRYVYR